MSQRNIAQPKEGQYSEEFELRTNEVIVVDFFNVRLFGKPVQDEGIESLARDIEKHGQNHAVLLRFRDKAIVAGHRRVRAITLLNQLHDRQCRPLLKVRCKYAYFSDEELFWIAVRNNMESKPLSPLDKLYLILQLRKRGPDWLGWSPGTLRIAEYMGMSANYVRVHERLADASYHVQGLLHENRLSVDSAMCIIGPPQEPHNHEYQDEIVARSTKKHVEDRTHKLVNDAETKKISNKEAARKLVGLDQERIELPAIQKAIRELEAEGHPPNVHRPPLSRKRPELIEAVTKLIESTDHLPSQDFLTYWLAYAAGSGTQEELIRRFSLIRETAPAPWTN